MPDQENSGVMQGPPVKERPPCVHDSRRLDGWLDTCCMGCGAGGYWRRGEQITHPAVGFDAKGHPSGKTLIREQAEEASS
jgi:hypothetical protein